MLKRTCLQNSRLPLVVLSRSLYREAPSYPDPQEYPALSFTNAKPLQAMAGPAGPWQEHDQKRYHKVLSQRVDRYGPIFKEQLGGELSVYIADPDAIRTAFQNETKVPKIAPLLQTTQMYRKKRKMSLGLGNMNGEEWYRLRSAVQQKMMRPNAVHPYLTKIVPIAENFIDKIRDIRHSTTNEIEDLRDLVGRWQLDSSSMTCFDTDLKALEAAKQDETDSDDLPMEMIRSNREIFRLTRQLRFSLPFYKIMPSPKLRRIFSHEDVVFQNGQRFVNEAIERMRTAVADGSLNETDFILLQYLAGRKELSFEDVSVIVLSLFTDGLSTTSPTLINNLYCLATNPEAQRRAVDEIKDARQRFGHHQITVELLQSLTFLKACIKEAFRLFPIGPGVTRIAQKHLVCNGYQIRPELRLELTNYPLLTSEKYFEQPLKFMPERWLRDGTARHIHPYILLPFGHGPRMCAGRRFAEQELLLMLVKVLTNFTVEWCHAEPLEQEYVMLLWPDKAHFAFRDR